MPRLSSLELDAAGKSVRPGQPFSLREDWVWALPKDAPDAELAYSFVTFLWERDNHRRECEAIGTLPLRMDVTKERASLFRLEWMDDIFDAVFAEWEHAAALPDDVVGGNGSRYAQLWQKIVADETATTPEQILAALKAAPPARPPPPVTTTLHVPDAMLVDGGIGDPNSEDDEDTPLVFDDELWRGKAELDLPGANTPKGARP